MRTRLTYLLAASLAAFGCGDDDGSAGPDGGPSADAAPRPDASPTGGTCGVTGAGVGNLVAFNRPDGSLLGTAITDVDGNASFDFCVADTMITFVGEEERRGARAEEENYFLATLTGIQPGDTLAFGNDDEDYGYINYDVAANVSALDTPSTYTLYYGCGSRGVSPGGGYTPYVYENCVGADGNIDALVVARQAGGDTVGSSQANDVSIAGFDGDTEEDVATSAWAVETPLASINVSATNPPAMAYDAFVGYRQVRQGVGYNGTYEGFQIGDSPTPYYDVINPLPHGYFTNQEAQSGALFGLPVMGGFFPFSYSLAATASASAAGDIAIDLSATLLPRIAGVFATVDGDPSRPIVTWPADGSFEGATAGIFAVAFGEDIGFGPPPRGMWVVITHEPGAGTFQMPELPDSLLAIAPRETDELLPMLGAVVDLTWLTYTQILSAGADDPFTALGLGYWSEFFFNDDTPPSLKPTTNDYSRRQSVWTIDECFFDC